MNHTKFFAAFSTGFVFFTGLVFLVFWASRPEEKGSFYDPAENIRISSPAYAGTQRCASCHPEQWRDFQTSGHAYASFPIRHGKIEVPFLDLQAPEESFDFSKALYGMGGRMDKLLFLDREGYVLTGHSQAFFLGRGWTFSFEEKPVGKRENNCMECHATGHSPGYNERFPGVVGNFVFWGVQCEACHGPGARHAKSPKQNRMKMDRASHTCIQCHRLSGGLVLMDGLIKHKQAGQEMLLSGHRYLTCVSCHDPHRTTRLQAGSRENAIVKDCTDCHRDMPSPVLCPNRQCTDCHMPKCAISVFSKGDKWHRQGDTMTHIVGIDLKPALFEEISELQGRSRVLLLEKSKKTYKIPVNYSCGHCHDGGHARRLDPQEMSVSGARMHPAKPLSPKW